MAAGATDAIDLDLVRADRDAVIDCSSRWSRVCGVLVLQARDWRCIRGGIVAGRERVLGYKLFYLMLNLCCSPPAFDIVRPESLAQLDESDKFLHVAEI